MIAELFPEFQVIVVPGLHDSGPDHWQSRWHRAHPEFYRVQQDDWSRPDLRAWSAQVDAVRRRDPRPALFIAHSFGCLATAASLARESGNAAGALLVAPADPDKFGVARQLPGHPLPCPSLMVGSTDDPWMRFEHAAQWAARWGSVLVNAGALGHINSESQLDDWDFGKSQLQRMFNMAHNERLTVPASMPRCTNLAASTLF
jgi:uncharacterized protein